MIKNVELDGKIMRVSYEFTEEEIEILRHLKREGFKEFNLWTNSDVVDNLYDYGFVRSVDGSWHYTVKLTELGKKAVESLD